MADYSGGNAGCYHIGGDVAGDYRTGGDDGVVTYGDSGGDGGVCSYPYTVADADGFVMEVLTPGRGEVMVERCQHHTMPYQTTVSDENTSLVLKMARGVDEYFPAYVDIAPEIGVERREEPEVGVNLLSYNLAEYPANLFRSMVLVVQFKLQPAGDIALLTHELYHLITFEGFPLGYHLLESLYCHSCVGFYVAKLLCDDD